MGTLAITLTDPLTDYVEERIRSGKSVDHSQVVQKALRVLQAVEARQSAFEAAIQEGLNALEAGDYEDVDDLEAWFEKHRPGHR